MKCGHLSPRVRDIGTLLIFALESHRYRILTMSFWCSCYALELCLVEYPKTLIILPTAPKYNIEPRLFLPIKGHHYYCYSSATQYNPAMVRSAKSSSIHLGKCQHKTLLSCVYLHIPWEYLKAISCAVINEDYSKLNHKSYKCLEQQWAFSCEVKHGSMLTWWCLQVHTRD